MSAVPPQPALHPRSGNGSNDVDLPDAPPLALQPSAPPSSKPMRVEINYIRAFAALAVVQMHSAGELLFSFNAGLPYDGRWWTGNICYSLLRWATPFFIMISGSIMLHPARNEAPGVFLRKRMNRILPPFAFWSVVYLFYQYRGNIYDGNLPGWQEVWGKIIYEDVYYHLWFIPMIIGMYLLTPTFQIFVRHAKRSDIEYFLVFSFTVTALQHFIQNLFVVKYIGWLGYIGYYVLGYYLSQYTLPWKKYLYAAALAMPAVTAIGTFLLTRQAGAYSNTIFVYFSPNVVIMSAALFLFLREANWQAFAVRFPRLDAMLNWLAPLSFGVYFVHVLLIDMLKNANIGQLKITYDVFLSQPVPPILGVFLIAVVAASASATLIFLMSKVKGLGRWVM